MEILQVKQGESGIEEDGNIYDDNEDPIVKTSADSIVSKREERKKRKIGMEQLKEMASNHPMLPPCECATKKCFTNIDLERRQQIRDSFWELPYNDRRIWIFNHVEQFEPRRRYSTGDNSKVQMSRNYWLPDNTLPSRKLFVCKRMFLNTIGHHSDKIITTALITTTDIGTNCGDLRGKHPKKHGITEEQRAFMKRHIRSFKPQISRYRRAHAPNRLYLPCELTITEMYVDYVEECKRRIKMS